MIIITTIIIVIIFIGLFGKLSFKQLMAKKRFKNIDSFFPLKSAQIKQRFLIQTLNLQKKQKIKNFHFKIIKQLKLINFSN